jgi:hypothetical protein
VDNRPAASARIISRNQKEIVIEMPALKSKGYPAPVNLDTGAGKPKTAPAAKSPAKPPTP